MDDKTNAKAGREQQNAAPTRALPPASAEFTAALDPSTSADFPPPGQVPANDPSVTEVDRPDPLQEKRYSFLQPGTRPDSLGRLGHYEVLRGAGEGGFGIVLQAFDENLHRLVAIKVLGPQLVGNATVRSRFVREARAAAAVNSKYVVGTYEVYEQPIPHLVMEYVAGKTLQDRIEQQGAFETRDVFRIGAEIAEGLAAAHQQGLIHRDIKPANILLEEKDEGGRMKDESRQEGFDSSFSSRVKIADFGLARAVDDASLTQSGVIAGTPMYMSPEQARGDTLDPRTDLFSLGSVLYAMCTGQPPFPAHKTLGVMKRVCDDAPRPIRESNAAIPDELAAIVGLLHVKDPAGRFQTAAAVADALLRQHLAHLDDPSLPAPPRVPVAAPPGRLPPESKSPDRKGRRTLWLWSAAACLLLIAVGSLVPFLLPPNPEAAKGQPSIPPDPRLLAVLRGEEQPTDNAERLELARQAYDHKHFAGAARLRAEAMAIDPKLGDDREAEHRYHAARAELAAAGQGKDDPPPDDAAKAKLRRQALDRLTAELTAWGKLYESGPRDRPAIVAKLSGWKQESDLASLRDAAVLSRLPADEQKAFAELWAAVSDPDTFFLLQSGAPRLLRIAAVQAWRGQDEELAATRDRTLRFAKDTTNATTAERTAKICCLSPADAKTYEAALVLARRAVALGKMDPYLVYFQMCLGMAEYRNGHYAEADAALLAAAKLAGDNKMVARTSAIYRAMTLFRQGQAAEARKVMDEAVVKMPLPPADAKSLRVEGVSADDLILWMAYKEAKALLK